MLAMVTRLRIQVAALVSILAAISYTSAGAVPDETPAALREGSLRESAHAAAQSPQRRRRGFELTGVYKARIEPHWFADNDKFWYRNRLRDSKKEFILVDATSGTRQKAFDHEKLAAALAAASESTQKPDALPFDRIEFVDDGKAVRFIAEKSQWEWQLDAGESKKLGEAADEEADDDDSDNERFRRGRRFRRDDDDRGRRGVGGPSPDGDWHAFVRNHNVYIRPAGEEEESETAKKLEFQLTVDGVEKGRYGMLQWSPDSKALVAFRIEPGDNKEVYLIESSPEGSGRAKLRSRSYDLPGDKLTSYELSLFDVETKKQVKPEMEKIDLHFPRLYWNSDGRHFDRVLGSEGESCEEIAGHRHARYDVDIDQAGIDKRLTNAVVAIGPAKMQTVGFDIAGLPLGRE
jgi:hypothetical protein